MPNVRGLVVLCLVLVGACSTGDPTADEIGARARDYQQLDRIDARPFQTAQHQGHPLVNVWADELASAPYRQLSAGTPAIVPEGGMIVKEMLDADGGPPLLTVMVKQPTGYDGARGDWWYGRLDANGNATGPGFTGRVGFCIGCHIGAASHDYLFGVSADNLSPAP